MSRRSHHRGHRHPRPNRPEPAAGPSRPTTLPGEVIRAAGASPAPVPAPSVAGARLPNAVAESQPVPPPSVPPPAPAQVGPAHATPAPAGDPVAHAGLTAGSRYENVGPAGSGCTTAQLRRFIKSRAWVPMHELRRRFGINGLEDDVTPVAVDGSTIFVGLPSREALLLGELLRGGDIGYELSMDPRSPIVIGVYPMRPVPRH
jgi:hypothetical protein